MLLLLSVRQTFPWQKCIQENSKNHQNLKIHEFVMLAPLNISDPLPFWSIYITQSMMKEVQTQWRQWNAVQMLEHGNVYICIYLWYARAIPSFPSKLWHKYYYYVEVCTLYMHKIREPPKNIIVTWDKMKSRRIRERKRDVIQNDMIIPNRLCMP